MPLKKWKILLWLPLCLALTPSVYAEDGVSPTEIVLGQSAAFKGPAAGLGTELWRGAQAYFDKTNAEGGVKGRQIRVISYDDGYEGDATLANTTKLITQDKVFALFGYVGTPTLLKALPAIQEHKDEGLFLFSDFTGAQPQREKPYDKIVFNVRASYRQETAGLVRHFLAMGLTKIGTFIQDDAYGESGSDGVARALEARGLSIVAKATYERNVPYSTDMSAQVKALKDAGVEAVIAVGAYNQCAAFIRDARNAGWKVPIANVSFVGADELLGKLIVEEKAAGKTYTSRLVNSQVVPSWYDTTNPLVQEYSAMMDQYDPKVPADLRDPGYRPAKYSFGSLEGYLDAKLFVSILRKAPADLTRASFLKAAESFHGLSMGKGASLGFSPSNHQASSQVFFTTVEKGQWEPLKDWSVLR